MNIGQTVKTQALVTIVTKRGFLGPEGKKYKGDVLVVAPGRAKQLIDKQLAVLANPTPHEETLMAEPEPRALDIENKEEKVPSNKGKKKKKKGFGRS